MASFADLCFRWSLRNQLIYPSCWEDPRVDREALCITPNDTVVTITSGGCNALDYLLDEPLHVHAVDINFRQNALLELKLAGIRDLEFEHFFDLFGKGYSDDANQIYHQTLRDDLTDVAKAYWDKHIGEFGNRQRPFYLRGGIGTGAWLFQMYVDRIARIRRPMDRLFHATSCAEQVQIYREELRDRFWSGPLRWTFNRKAVLAFAGIPTGQIALAQQHISDIAEHMDACAEDVLRRVPLSDNYFWQLYVNGEFRRDCCPEYLKPDNFARLKAGLVNRISVHTSSLTDFFNERDFFNTSERGITKFAMLDHFDWYFDQDAAKLSDAWQAILNAAGDNARLLWRSMGNSAEFMHDVRIDVGSESRKLRDLLAYQHELAKSLQERERVNAYSGLFIADLRTA